MFSKIWTTKSTENYSSQIEKLKKEFEAAETIVIGAGAGLSTSAGFVYDGERFRQYFSDFEEKYGFHDMYSGGFYPYNTLEAVSYTHLQYVQGNEDSCLRRH